MPYCYYYGFYIPFFVSITYWYWYTKDISHDGAIFYLLVCQGFSDEDDIVVTYKCVKEFPIMVPSVLPTVEPRRFPNTYIHIFCMYLYTAIDGGLSCCIIRL